MFEAIQKLTDQSQTMSKEGFEAALRSYGELNKGFQAITANMTDYSKRAFEDAAPSSSWLAQSRSSRPSRSNLNTLRRPMTPGSPRHRSSARCTSAWLAMPIGRSSKPLPRERPRPLPSPNLSKQRPGGCAYRVFARPLSSFSRNFRLFSMAEGAP
jgi:hypothetical protein